MDSCFVSGPLWLVVPDREQRQVASKGQVTMPTDCASPAAKTAGLGVDEVADF
jgi:hypothetical protein